MRITLSALGLSSALVLSFAAPSYAQSSDLAFDEIIVTATKRDENIQDVPLSVTALPQDVLDTFGGGGDDIQYLSARVPSLVIESSFGRIFPRSYIRGLGNTDFDLNASQPVSFIYDDIVYENPVLKGKFIKRYKRFFADVEIDYIYKKSVLNFPNQDFTVATGYLKVATPELVAFD